ncbi:MAG: hypothetical protein RLZZ381_2837 [Cyanobacteriota bacterium]|jgi:hypothetical protein
MRDKYFSRRSFVIGLSILSIVQLGCLDKPMNSNLPSAIFQHWIHSREEDTEMVKVYRPSSYQFPPSRGRDGFEIKKNGEFIQYGIGATDRPQKITGTWQAEEDNRIKITWENQNQKSYTMQVLSCDERLLKIGHNL